MGPGRPIVVGKGRGNQQDGALWEPTPDPYNAYPTTDPDTILVRTSSHYAYATRTRRSTRWGGKPVDVWDMRHVETVVKEVNGKLAIVGQAGDRFATGYSRVC